MQNQDSHKDYFDLISRYLSGNASDAEVKDLEAWVVAAPENKAQFIANKKAWMLSGLQKSGQQVAVDKIWEKTSEQLFGEAKVVKMKPKPNRRIWLSIAATIALLIVASVWLFQTWGPSDLLVETNDQIKSIDLPDGSEVTLNQFASLRFVPVNKEGQRKVELKGDAFFEVARDEQHPFVIQTEQIEIEVLGTSFYVDARTSQSEVQVIVKSGSVAVRSGDSETVLTANEKAVFQKKNNALIKLENKDPNYLSLTNNRLVFEGASLEEVVFALNRQYHTDITIANEAIKRCKLTATYDHKSLEAILAILEGTFSGIDVKHSGEKVTLVGTSCD